MEEFHVLNVHGDLFRKKRITIHLKNYLPQVPEFSSLDSNRSAQNLKNSNLHSSKILLGF